MNLSAQAKTVDRDTLSERASRYSDPSDPWRLRALIDLSVSYWKTGEFEEGLIVIDQVLMDEDDVLVRLEAGIVKSVLLAKNGEPESALRLLMELKPDDAPVNQRGKYFAQRAFALVDMGQYDLALIDYAGAYQYFLDAGNEVYAAAVKNNIARVYRDAHRFNEAHEVVDEASKVFEALGAMDHLAESKDQKAKIFLAEGKLAKARKAAETSITLLGQLDRPSILAESLITYGTILARLGEYSEARICLSRAGETCERNGHRELAGLAYLTMLEELPLAEFGKAKMYSDPLRVFRAQLSLTKTLAPHPSPHLIDLALKRSNNVYEKAASLLGVTRPALMKAADKHGITVKPKRRRAKSIIVK